MESNIIKESNNIKNLRVYSKSNPNKLILELKEATVDFPNDSPPVQYDVVEKLDYHAYMVYKALYEKSYKEESEVSDEGSN